MQNYTDRTTCAIAGGGPAGMFLGLLLARAGVEVTVLEKHNDFLRDFRGDTVHPSTLQLLDELGLAGRFDALRPQYFETLSAALDWGTFQVADFRRLRRWPRRLALIPQWDLLDLLADAARAEPTFHLVMNAEVTGVRRASSGRADGVVYQHDGQPRELAADLVVGCDGRTSRLRAAAGYLPREFGVPMDVLWFRLPRRVDDPRGGFGRFGRSTIVVVIDRGDYYQMGFLIRKGSQASVHADGIERFRERIAAAIPWLADRVDTLTSFDDVKLLSVALSRLSRWYGDGLLFLGDAAHAMSPVGGVGINLAVQDAVAAARILAGPLARGELTTAALRRVQWRRWFPTAATQSVQRLAHRVVVGRAVAAADATRPIRRKGRPPLPFRLLQRFPRLQAVPAYVIGVGALPEHAPQYARRGAAVRTS